jgi:Flp pilus assembly protein TadB
MEPAKRMAVRRAAVVAFACALAAMFVAVLVPEAGELAVGVAFVVAILFAALSSGHRESAPHIQLTTDDLERAMQAAGRGGSRQRPRRRRRAPARV